MSYETPGGGVGTCGDVARGARRSRLELLGNRFTAGSAGKYVLVVRLFLQTQH
jgi:hypothetical protein